MKWGYYNKGEIPSLDNFVDGSHIVYVVGINDYVSKAIELEDLGWEIRDCIKIIKNGESLQALILRKSIKGTIVNNLINNGCGGINIDVCRIQRNEGDEATQGRYPSNLIFDTFYADNLDTNYSQNNKVKTSRFFHQITNEEDLRRYLSNMVRCD